MVGECFCGVLMNASFEDLAIFFPRLFSWLMIVCWRCGRSLESGLRITEGGWKVRGLEVSAIIKVMARDFVLRIFVPNTNILVRKGRSVGDESRCFFIWNSARQCCFHSVYVPEINWKDKRREAQKNVNENALITVVWRVRGSRRPKSTSGRVVI